jgi:large subunit ribosomal protein L3
VVVQRKSAKPDGYEAVQLGFEEQKESRLTKPEQGHFKKAGAKPAEGAARSARGRGRGGEGRRRADGEDVRRREVRGRAGPHEGPRLPGRRQALRFAGGRASHGGGWNRKPGSIGNREWPARVFKNKKLPGHMGSVDITTQNLRVVKVLADDHALLLEGAVPGPMGGIVLVRKAIKKA